MDTNVTSIERNLEVANVWLNELVNRMPATDRDDAWERLRAVLQTIRDRLPVDEAAEFAAQLPDLIRGIYYSSWNPSDTPHKWRKREEYLAAVGEKLGPRSDAEVEETIRAVLQVAAQHLDAGALQKVKEAHPKEVWDLWPTH